MNLQGVYKETQKNGKEYFRSSLTYKNKHISLGSYDEETSAHQAYLYGKEILDNKNIDISDYPDNCILIFDKFVQLVNFRDNHLYFSTPVYLRKSYFSYFYSPNIELKFDNDDLFYFTSHKIMKRGNHFFVADFGMQESLNDRYKIRPFSVINKDYRFINDDRYDFRRENIEIINPFFGVRKTNSSTPKYEVTIHVAGNLKVGVYSDIYEAAIAYNKAGDILNKKGLKKNFYQNFIEALSAREYAQIYTDVSISDSVKNYSIE